MTFGISPQNSLDYVGLQITAVPAVQARREPTTSDRNYPMWTEWRVAKNPSTGTEGDFWKLIRFDSSGNPIWVKIASAESGGVVTLSDTAGTIVDADSDGNVQIYGSGGVSVVSDAGNNRIAISLVGNAPAILSTSPDTGASAAPNGSGVVGLKGQSIPNTYGIETFNIDANTIGIRMKSPFIGNFNFQNTTGGETETLTVENTVDQASSTAIIAAKVAGATSADAYFQAIVNGGTTWSWGIDNSDDDAWLLGDGATLGGAPTVMRADRAGWINFPGQPAAQAFVNTPVANATGDGTAYTVIFDSESVDRQNNYNPATGVFTCPVAGNYLITSNISIDGLAAGNTSGSIRITQNGSTAVDIGQNVGAMRTAANALTLQVNNQLICAANDTLTIQVVVNGGGKVVGVASGDVQFTLLS